MRLHQYALLTATTFIAALMGCAQPTPPLYHWEGYQRQLYEHFKGTESDAQAQLRLLQAQSQKAQGAGAALPPGFRAHVGLLYLKLGRADEAQRQFEGEKSAFPESTPYMDFLLQRMNPQAIKTEAPLNSAANPAAGPKADLKSAPKAESKAPQKPTPATPSTKPAKS